MTAVAMTWIHVTAVHVTLQLTTSTMTFCEDGLGMTLGATTILNTSGDVLAVIMTAIDSCYDSLLQLQRSL